MELFILFIGALAGALIGSLVGRRFFRDPDPSLPGCFVRNRQINVNLAGDQIKVVPRYAPHGVHGNVTWRVNGPPNQTVVIRFIDRDGKNSDGPFPPLPHEDPGKYEIQSGNSKTTNDENVSNPDDEWSYVWKYKVRWVNKNIQLDPMLVIGE
jgi:hypothetical protein